MKTVYTIHEIMNLVTFYVQNQSVAGAPRPTIFGTTWGMYPCYMTRSTSDQIMSS